MRFLCKERVSVILFIAMIFFSCEKDITPPDEDENEVVQDKTPPRVSILYPVNNDTISGVVTIKADATDESGVDSVKFYIDGDLAYTDSSSPWEYNLDTYSLLGNPHTIMAKAYDPGGNIGTSDPLIFRINYPPNIPNLYGDSEGCRRKYVFWALSTDPEGDSIAYQFDWGDGNVSSWSSYIPSGNSVSMSHSYSSEGTYYVKAKVKDMKGNESDWSKPHRLTVKNYPPSRPYMGGLGGGCTDIPYDFVAYTHDPDEDKIAYRFNWGDGNISGWSNFVKSGKKVTMSHSYSNPGTFTVKAQAKDVYGAESEWSSDWPFYVTQP